MSGAPGAGGAGGAGVGGGGGGGGGAGAGAAALQVDAEVLAAEPLDGYTRLVLAAPGLPPARPGQFVTVAVGGSHSALTLRRAFGLHHADGGAGTVSVVVAAAGAGSRWLTERRPGDRVDLVGPLGQPFATPVPGEHVVLVGGGYGAAALAWAAREARGAGATAHAVVGAATAGRLCDVAGIAAQVAPCGGETAVTTDDGSAGEQGQVTGPLGRLLHRLLATGSGPARVAACGPMAMLRAVHELAEAVPAEAVPAERVRPVAPPGGVRPGEALRVEVAVEEAMACGIGVCMTCVLPARGRDGRTRMLRTCVDGPVLDSRRIRWDAVGPAGSAVPADAVGAPEGGAA